MLRSEPDTVDFIGNLITCGQEMYYVREKTFREIKKRCRDDHCSKK